jgi:thiol-disulfide isomerase/thioredoxin
MRKQLKLAVLALFSASLLSACGGGSSTAEESFIEGSGAVTFIEGSNRSAAPELSGMTLSGKQFIFNPTLIELAKQYPDVQFMGILTRDNPATAEAFARRLAMPYPTFIDDSLLIGFKGTLPANAIPSTVLLDKDGNVAARISGEVTLTSLSKLIRKLEAE